MRIYGKKPPSPSDRPTEDEGFCGNFREKLHSYRRNSTSS